MGIRKALIICRRKKNRRGVHKPRRREGFKGQDTNKGRDIWDIKKVGGVL